jgi:hypothetical protein
VRKFNSAWSEDDAQRALSAAVLDRGAPPAPSAPEVRTFGHVASEYLDFKGLSEAKKKKWWDAYMWFYRRLALKHGKRLVMKTPANAARLKQLTRLFPAARYVYLARNRSTSFPPP